MANLACSLTLVTVLLTAALLAGCTDGITPVAAPLVQIEPGPASHAFAHDEPAAPVAGERNAVRTRSNHSEEVYSFSGRVRGTSAPDHFQPGPLVGRIPAAKTATFEAPDGTISLSFALDALDGSGTGRIEVYGPTGELVHTSYTWVWVEHPVSAGGGRDSVWTAARSGAGIYEVRYYVAGAYDIAFRANATIDDELAAVVSIGPAPAIFSGHILAPDPGFSLVEDGCPYFGHDPDQFRNVSWQSFTFDRSYANWTFAFDVKGMVASFPDTPALWDASPSGRVPEGAMAIVACSQAAIDTDYRLTLTPPEA